MQIQSCATLLLIICLQLSDCSNSWDFLDNDRDFRDLFLAELYSEVASDILLSTPSPKPAGPPLYNGDELRLPKESLRNGGRAEQEWSKSIKQRIPEQEDNIIASGYQLMSGGAGEGKQHLKPEGSIDNKQEIKSDEDLPSYCSPPNPCPKGKTAADGCEERIPDTADFNKEYILRQMRGGLCTCDYEHMYPDSCPLDNSIVEAAASDFDDYIDGIFNKQKSSGAKNPYISVGEKRVSLTAKKGGQHVIHKRSNKEYGTDEKIRNPYLAGLRLPVVAKKSPPMI